MKITIALTAMFLAQSFSINAFAGADEILSIDAKLNCPIIHANGGRAFLTITILTKGKIAASERKPMNLSIVLDRSGSMSDQRKMDFAKKAFAQLVEQLQPDDILSVVIYDDEIDVLRKAKRVGGEKKEIIRILDEIYPRNSTNLGGGLLEGLKQAAKNSGKEYINRVILLSDGLANVGITEPRELNKIARRYKNKAISISTMGVGLDYNENLMMGLSESGGGNYYFIEHPNSLASIVRKEFEMLSSVVAQNAEIHLRLGKNINLADVIGSDFSEVNNAIVIPVGDLYANDRREFTLEFAVPEGSGAITLAEGKLRYANEISGKSRTVFSSTVKYSKDYALIERSRDMETQAKADVAVSTRNVQRAMEAMDRGDEAQAAEEFKSAQEFISTSSAAGAGGEASAAIQSQSAKIKSYEQIMKTEKDSRRAKKSIQYENYKTQKSK